MEKKEFIFKLIRNYFIVFAIIVFVTAFLNMDHAFTFKEIMLMAAFALAGDLPSLVYYSADELPPKQKNIRRGIHFILLECVIILFGNLIGQVSSLAGNLFLALEVAVIYVLVCLVSWYGDLKTASQINEKLKDMKLESNNMSIKNDRDSNQ